MLTFRRNYLSKRLWQYIVRFECCLSILVKYFRYRLSSYQRAEPWKKGGVGCCLLTYSFVCRFIDVCLFVCSALLSLLLHVRCVRVLLHCICVCLAERAVGQCQSETVIVVDITHIVLGPGELLLLKHFLASEFTQCRCYLLDCWNFNNFSIIFHSFHSIQLNSIGIVSTFEQ